MSPVSSNRNPIAVNVNGSYGETANKRLRINCAARSEAASPAVKPNTTNRPASRSQWARRAALRYQKARERHLDLAAVRGAVYQLSEEVVRREEAREHGFEVRPVERQVLRLIGVADFLSLKTAPAADANPAGIA